MERSEWEKTLTRFQARARGSLVRKEVRRARDDFEDIVKEIDGGLTHLRWRETVIPLPHFSDVDGPFAPSSSSTFKASDPVQDVGGDTSEGQQRDPLRTDADRDEPQPKSQASPLRDCATGCKDAGDAQGLKEKDRRMLDSAGDSTAVWSSLELDMNFGPAAKGCRQFCSAQAVPRTSEALRLHRNTLTMELLWLQQAIDSRKKYLSLKNRLSVS
ncbi:IQ domain-containing protein C isoform X2 [Nelusetta ayraudi]|uniref:IQ domain-containing protein C isoform X2 n=1 Tax=Nelusetta ayraudi TaxID=303726 RepID=UPI003F702695